MLSFASFSVADSSVLVIAGFAIMGSVILIGVIGFIILGRKYHKLKQQNYKLTKNQRGNEQQLQGQQEENPDLANQLARNPEEFENCSQLSAPFI